MGYIIDFISDILELIIESNKIPKKIRCLLLTVSSLIFVGGSVFLTVKFLSDGLIVLTVIFALIAVAVIIAYLYMIRKIKNSSNPL